MRDPINGREISGLLSRPTETRKFWKGADGDRKPELVEVEAGDFRRNMHFDTEEQAWENIRANVNAGVRLAAGHVERCREALRQAEQNAADICCEFKEVEGNYQRWKEANARKG